MEIVRYFSVVEGGSQKEYADNVALQKRLSA